jgi:hypothetical protein
MTLEHLVDQKKPWLSIILAYKEEGKNEAISQASNASDEIANRPRQVSNNEPCDDCRNWLETAVENPTTKQT